MYYFISIMSSGIRVETRIKCNAMYVRSYKGRKVMLHKLFSRTADVIISPVGVSVVGIIMVLGMLFMLGARKIEERHTSNATEKGRKQ